MTDTAICVFCESGDHENPLYDARVCRCGCLCHHLEKPCENGTFVPLTDPDSSPIL